MTSTLRFKEEALKALDPIRDRLVEFGETHQEETGLERVVDLERAFGDDLVKYFCIPLKMSFGSCLLAAAAVAYGNPVETGPLTEDPTPIAGATTAPLAS